MKTIKTRLQSACRGLGPCQMFRKMCTDHSGIYVCLYFDVFLQNYRKPTIKSSATYNLADVGAPGVLKTASACIFHHLWYGKTKISMIFDHLHRILQHIYCILYHKHGISIVHMAFHKKRTPHTPWGNPLPGCRLGPGSQYMDRYIHNNKYVYKCL